MFVLFSKFKEVQDAIEHYQRASNPSSKVHEHFDSAQNFASPNLDSKLNIDIDNNSVSSNDLYIKEHSD